MKLFCAATLLGRNKTCVLLLVVLILTSCRPAFAKTGPTLLSDHPRTPELPVGGGGLTMKYKRVSGPYQFGGDMIMWGLRGAGGRLADPKLGVMGSVGVLTGNALELNVTMGGLTIERGFIPDPRFKWRVGFGLGTYDLSSNATGRTLNKGSFSFLEPMLVGLLPMSRHIVLEFGAGYTFAGSTGIRLEGILLQAELLFGRF